MKIRIEILVNDQVVGYDTNDYPPVENTPAGAVEVMTRIAKDLEVLAQASREMASRPPPKAWDWADDFLRHDKEGNSPLALLRRALGLEGNFSPDRVQRIRP